MQISNTKLGIIAGLAVTGVVVYYLIKKNTANALPAGKARFAKCKNGTTVKIINDTPCLNKGGIENIFVADDTQSALLSKPKFLPENIKIDTSEPTTGTKILPKDTFAPINMVETFSIK